MELDDFATAIPDLERVVAGDPKFDYHRAAGLLADAYAKTGQYQRATSLFEQVTQFSTTPETLYNYANYLKLLGRGEGAREWTQTSVVTSKPANGDQVKTGQRMWPGTSFFYPVFSWSGKPVFVLQLRGPHFRI